ncbi:hypothetical protein D3C76_163660 [compost metagenome]
MANDFLPFAGAGGANVMTQAAYAGLAARTAGFSSGTAQSAQLNKVWRQSSIIAAAVAQAISDLTGLDSIDDGTTATIVANLKKAISAQSATVVGTSRNVKGAVLAASASMTITADEIIVKSALGGLSTVLSSFNKTINLATVGAGGMDVGAAPVTSYVAIYAIWNPTTSTSALLARANGTATPSTEVYNGANMPAGYTQSALLTVLPTNASSQFIPLLVADRHVSVAYRAIINTAASAPITVSVAAAIPSNARHIDMVMSMINTVANAVMTSIMSPTNLAGVSPGQVNHTGSPNVANNGWSITAGMDISTPQTVTWTGTSSAGVSTFNIGVIGYDI